MGIHDRDWYHDHHRNAAAKAHRPSASRFRIRASKSGWFPWFAWIALFVCIFLVTKLLLEAKRDMPFPETGQVHWFIERASETVAPLTIIAPSDGQVQYVVHLDDWESKAPVAMIPVRGYEAAKIEVSALSEVFVQKNLHEQACKSLVRKYFFLPCGALLWALLNNKLNEGTYR